MALAARRCAHLRSTDAERHRATAGAFAPQMQGQPAMRFFGRFFRNSRPSRTYRHARPFLEALEDRTLPTGNAVPVFMS
jgi:hypothetical protein